MQRVTANLGKIQSKIFNLLVNGGRLTVQEIAISTGFSKSQIYGALDRLEQRGIVISYAQRGWCQPPLYGLDLTHPIFDDH